MKKYYVIYLINKDPIFEDDPTLVGYNRYKTFDTEDAHQYMKERPEILDEYLYSGYKLYQVYSDFCPDAD